LHDAHEHCSTVLLRPALLALLLLAWLLLHQLLLMLQLPCTPACAASSGNAGSHMSSTCRQQMATLR
jgi:hypothetical protein